MQNPKITKGSNRTLLELLIIQQSLKEPQNKFQETLFVPIWKLLMFYIELYISKYFFWMKLYLEAKNF